MSNEIDLVVGSVAFKQITDLLTELKLVDDEIAKIGRSAVAMNTALGVKNTADLTKLSAENAKLNKEIQKHEDYVRIINPTNLNRYNFYMSAQNTLKRLYKIRENLKNQTLAKKQFKSNRNEILEKGKEDLEG